MHRLKLVMQVLLVFNIKASAGIAQNYQNKSVVYNVAGGAMMGGIGALINKKPAQKWHKAVWKGFLGGAIGGSLTFTGKKLNRLIPENKQLGYAYLSRMIFSAGNSVIENAAANRKLWEEFHYDIGFIRFQYNTQNAKFLPRVMISSLGSTVFLAVNGHFDFKTTIRSGTITFRTEKIRYSPNFSASTPGNGFLIIDSLQRGPEFYNIYAHEMIHAFQFQEFSPAAFFFKSYDLKWREKFITYDKLRKYFFGDINYECMLVNYFLVQKGYKNTDYCHNFMENEAESLSTGRSSCP